MTDTTERAWLKVLGPDELAEGRVVSVTCAHRTVCMTRHEGHYAALDNKCPHQGGPLGEGSIENGWLRCQEKDSPFSGRKVISVSGDGGFGQYLAELTTAVKYGMNITHVLLHNGELGKISKEQLAGDWDVWQTSLHNPDFSQYANLCGALGIRVTADDQLDDALCRAFAHDGPSLVEIISDAKLI